MKNVDLGFTRARTTVLPPGRSPIRSGMTSKLRSWSGSDAVTVTSATALPMFLIVRAWLPALLPRDVCGATWDASCTNGATTMWPSSTVAAEGSAAARTAIPNG